MSQPSLSLVQHQWLTSPEALFAAWKEFEASAKTVNEIDNIDAFSHPDYLTLERLMSAGEAGFVQGVMTARSHSGGSLWFPICLRPLPEYLEMPDCFDASSPYGYGGPLWVGGWTEQERAAFFGIWSEWCAEQKIVAEFIRFHPLLENHRFLPDSYSCFSPKTVVWIDLTQSAEAIWAGLHPQKRRDINKKEAYGLVFHTEWSHIGAFSQIYQETMVQNQAQAYYFFSPAFYTTLEKIETPPETLWLHSVAAEESVLSSAMFLTAGTTVHYFLSGTNAAGRPKNASTLLLWETICRAKAAGFSRMILGGGVQAEDALFQFKRRFSPQTMPYWIATRVHDPKRYEKIRARVAQVAPDQKMPETLFFYRGISR